MIRRAFHLQPASWRRVLVLAFCLSAAACGGGGGGENSSGAADSPPQPTVPAPSPSPPQEPVDGGEQNPSLPADAAARTRDALRFLNQSTFGATKADLADLESIGYAAFLDKQFVASRTGYGGFNYLSSEAPAECRGSASARESPQSLCARDNFSLFEVQRQFFSNAMTGRDQLRQRVAFALSQIFVVSGTEITHAAGMASYQNLLLDHAFGNYRELLEAVTLHPVMGAYLDMANNARGTASRQANENYARECLQLFSIGTQMLDADGSVKVDADGIPIPAYDQDAVGNFAKALTGWTFAPDGGAAAQWGSPAYLVEPMVPIQAQHDTSGKALLNGVTLPAGQSAEADLDGALDSIFQHPNVGPFIGQRLIQHLVTSNPTPGYVARVAAVFDDNGRGVRGDLRAVVRAILLDAEARGGREDEADFGRLKDPVLFMTGLLRGLDGQSDGVYLRAYAVVMGQNIFTPPSVFSYYSPGNVIRGTELFGPEFGIYDSNRALLRAEFAFQMLYAGGVGADKTVLRSTGTSIDLKSFGGLSTPQVLDELDARLTNARLSAKARTIVGGAMDAQNPDDEQGRARAAAYLIAISPQYQVQR